MKENRNSLEPITETACRNINGGYVEPTPEQMEYLRKIYGPLADVIIYW